MRTMLWLALALFTASLHAQDPILEVPPTTASLEARLEALAADESLDPDLKTSLVDVLSKALESARAAATLEASTDALPTQESVAENLRDTLERLSNATAPELPRATPDLTLEIAESELAKAQQTQIATQALVTELERETARRASKRTEIPKRQAQLQKDLESLPRTVETTGTDARLAEARRLRLSADRHRLEAERTALSAEQQSYDAREQLLSARRDLAEREHNNQKAITDAWQIIVQDLRSASAAATQAAAEQATRQARDDHPLIQALAAENEQIAAELASVTDRQTAVESRIRTAQRLLARVEEQYQDIKQRADGAGSNQTLGRMLREGRAKLPNVNRIFRREGTYSDSEEADAYLASIDREQQRRTLINDPNVVARRVDEAVPEITNPTQRSRITSRARELMAARLEILETLSNSWSKYLANLQRLEASRQAVRDLVADYRAFVNERVLWIRSSDAIWHLDLIATWNAIRWFGSPEAWWNAGLSMWATASAELWPLLALLLLVAAWPLRRAGRRRLDHYRALAARRNNTDYSPTAFALLVTLLLAAQIPLLLWLAGHVLANAPEDAGFARALAVGLLHSAAFSAVLTTLHEVVQPGGLAEAHYNWRPRTLAVIRANLWLLVPAAFPLATAIGALEKHGDDAWIGSLGRLLLLPLVALSTVLIWRVLHPRHGILSGDDCRSFLHRFRQLCFLLAVGISSALFLLTILGYEYTVIQLVRSAVYTVAIVLAGVLMHASILHKLMLERRRLLIRQARERVEAERVAKEQDPADREAAETMPEEEHVELDPSHITEQTHALVRTAVVLTVLFACLHVWAEVLPALGALREVELWTDSSTEPPIQITLADLLKSLLIVFVTILAARNIPGLLEMLVLRRLNVQAGERFAITTLARYVLVTVGIVMAFAAIGLGWSKVQWLVAAVSLGLGFGLQEIFANFVSGLILLFERPVRVGDWVLVGDWLGKVTRIKIRATTVRDLDNKELVVPNKEFVTGRFVNWTLTDSLVRLRLPVGVAYGSDVQLAKRMMLKAADDAKLAVDTPPPRAVFLGFGDSSLNLELRVYVEDYQEHTPLLDDLHDRIDHLFRENDIEISFPQRDLHLRSARPLAEFLERHQAIEESRTKRDEP